MNKDDCYVLFDNTVFKVGEFYIISEKCNHEDWKTVLARPDLYPPLNKGDRVQFLGQTQNLYGRFAHVKLENGHVYDILGKYLEIITCTKEEQRK